MSFMQPEVYKASYYVIETTEGDIVLPADLCGTLEPDSWIESVADYIGTGEVCDPDECPELSEGWLYRMHAPGYMDTTELGYADSRYNAVRELIDLYGNNEGPREAWEIELLESLCPAVGSMEAWEKIVADHGLEFDSEGNIVDPQANENE